MFVWFVPVRKLKPVIANVPSTPGAFMAMSDTRFDHRFGAIDRGGIRQHDGDDEIALVLLRNESGRHGLEAEIRQVKQADSRRPSTSAESRTTRFNTAT